MKTTDESLREVLSAAFPDARLLECRELSGGVSARAVVCRLQLGDVRERADRREKVDSRERADGCEVQVVVRRPKHLSDAAGRAWAETEFAAVDAAFRRGIPVPRPRFVDARVPAIVLDYVEGALEFSPPELSHTLRQLAEHLALIHELKPAESAGLSQHLPSMRERAEALITRSPETQDAALDERRVRALAASLWPWADNDSVVLHGDYWPGNVLFRQGRVAAVLDWEDAAQGDALADLAIARLDVLWAFGREAMAEFTHYYQSCAARDWTRLPHWDLYAALRPMSQLERWAPAYSSSAIGRPDVTLQTMTREHRWFVARALHELGVSNP